MESNDIKQIIENSLKGAQVRVEGDDGRHFNAVIISDDVSEKNMLQRQQMVYASLGDLMTTGKVHAFSMKTYTTEEWEVATR